MSKRLGAVTLTKIILGTGAPAATYDYGYARAPQTYDTSKTYYQQAGAAPGYNPAYDAATAAKVFSKFNFFFSVFF